jgi:hypothetical protein
MRLGCLEHGLFKRIIPAAKLFQRTTPAAKSTASDIPRPHTTPSYYHSRNQPAKAARPGILYPDRQLTYTATATSTLFHPLHRFFPCRNRRQCHEERGADAEAYTVPEHLAPLHCHPGWKLPGLIHGIFLQESEGQVRGAARHEHADVDEHSRLRASFPTDGVVEH